MKLCLVVGTAVNIPLFFLFGNQGIISKKFFTQLFQNPRKRNRAGISEIRPEQCLECL